MDNDFRDQIKRLLKEGPGRKKKIVPRPWTWKDRILVLGLLLLTLSLVLFAWLQSKGSFSLPKIDLGEEKVIFKKDAGDILNNDPKRLDYQRKIKDNFRQITKDQVGTYGFYVFNLVTLQEYGLNEEEIFPAASLIKLPVLITLYQEAEKGNIDLDAGYSLQDSDKVTDTGSIWLNPSGTVFTYRELAKYMGKQSDNTAFRILINTLSSDKIQSTIDSLGMQDTSLEDDQTSPSDIGLLLQKLWMGKIVSDKDRDEILSFLVDTIFDDGWMPDGVDQKVRVAHKIGVEDESVSDAGIIFSNQPFVLVLMSKDVDVSSARNLIPDLTKIFYDTEGR